MAKKTVSKKATTEKPVAKKTATKKAATKKTAAKKASAKKASAKKTEAAKSAVKEVKAVKKPAKKASAKKTATKKKVKSPYPKSFLKAQLQRLRDERDNLIDQMSGVQKEQLRQQDSGAEASGLGDHLADAGNCSYDRDYALSLLSKEQGDLKDIDDAIARIEEGSYGVCEGCGETIPQLRLEARPAARYTVQYQEELEKNGNWMRRTARSSRVLGAEDGAIDSMEDSVDF